MVRDRMWISVRDQILCMELASWTIQVSPNLWVSCSYIEYAFLPRQAEFHGVALEFSI